MIYLFDESKRLTGIIAKEHVRTVRFSRERNSLYDIVAEIPVINYHQGERYNLHNKTKDAVFLGHYDLEDRFQLHKISLYDVDKGMIRIQAVHLFFDEAKAGAIIRERRYIDREVSDGARDAFAEIGWQMADYDVSPTRTYNFYNVSPLEARATLIETFGYEFDYWLDFDGKKISGKYFSVKRRIGGDSNKRYTYDKHTNTGHHVLSLRAEQDYSELYTAVIGRGRGEEYEDTGGYGRRIEFTDIAWSKPNDPLDKPIGSRVLVDPEATQAFGYVDGDSVKPRTAVVVFSDIEEQRELIEASYDWLVEHRQPKLLFDVKVADGDGLNLGDTVHIKYNEIGLNLAVRVGKVTEDLKTGERHVELGDVEYFSPGRSNREIKRSMAQDRRDAANRIFQLKQEFDENFDNRVNQMREDFEQELIDAHAEIQAAEERMETLINTTRTDWTDTFEAEVAEIYRKADEDYNRIETEITGVIDSTRNEMEMEFNDSVQNTRDYAEQQAQERADAVQSNLESATSSHQGMIDDLQTSVMDIDDFLGSDRNIGLNEMLYNERMLFEEKLNNADTWHYNILRGTRFDEGLWQGSNMEAASDGSLNYFEFVPSRNTSNVPYIQSNQEVVFNAGETYTLSFDFQTYSVSREVDYIFIIASVDDGGSNMNIWHPNLIEEGTHLNTSYGEEFQRYWVRFKPSRTIRGFVRIGLNMEGETRRGFRLALPYLTQTDNTRWLYNQLDNTQNIEEITRRVNQLEDGREEFITRTQYDFETGEIEGTMRSILETVDGRESIIQNHEDWINTNGASVIESAEGFQSKAWLADIHNPNLFSFTDVAELSHRNKWGKYRAPITGASYGEFARFRNMSTNGSIGAISPNLEIIEGETYTLTWIAFIYDDSLNHFDYCYIMTPDGNVGITPLSNRPERTLIPTSAGSYGGNSIYKYELTFTAPIGHEEASVMIGATAKADGVDASFSFKEPKLEIGDRATPYYNAFSMFSQRADEISLATQDTISQSDVVIRPEYVQIGSQTVDGSDLGALLRVSPDGIDAVAEAMRISGDLLIAGDVEAITGDFIEGNFARLWADEFEAITITGEHIETNTITAQHLTGADAILNYLMARLVFAEEVTALVGNFVDVNAGNIVTSGLSANIIESEHIAVGTALIDKMFATSARIDRLITKTHFVNEIKATSIDAVYADLRSVNSEIMDTNILKADWIQGGNALIDKVFANTAMFERMMAKSGFVRTLNTVTIDTDQLTIRRPDGVAWVSNGMARHDYNVQMTEFLGSSDVSWNGQWYETKSSSRQRCQIGSFKHVGRTLRAELNVRLSGYSPSQSEWMYYSIESFGSGLSFNRQGRILVRKTEVESFPFEINLGRPSFSNATFYIRFWRDSDGSHADNIVQLRCNRVSIED